MIVIISKKIRHILKLDFIRFCIVGGTGFLINIFILYILRSVLEAPLFFAQLVGSEIALFSNFMLHNHWTYKSNKTNKSLPKLFIQFNMTSWPAIIGSSFMVSAGVSILHFNYLIALTVSSIIVLGWNFVWSKYVIWKDVMNKEIIDTDN